MDFTRQWGGKKTYYSNFTQQRVFLNQNLSATKSVCSCLVHPYVSQTRAQLKTTQRKGGGGGVKNGTGRKL